MADRLDPVALVEKKRKKKGQAQQWTVGNDFGKLWRLIQFFTQGKPHDYFPFEARRYDRKPLVPLYFPLCSQSSFDGI